MIRVLLVDDHPIVRAGVAGVLHTEEGIEVVGEAASGSEAVTAARALRPDVVLTTYETDGDILRAIEAGATGYLLKDASRSDLIAAIRGAARGETVLAPSVAGRLVRSVRKPAIALSPREVEVLGMVAKGLSNSEIDRGLPSLIVVR